MFLQEVFLYESNRHRTANRRPRKSCNPEGNPKNHENKRRRPFTDNIEKLAEILFFHVGFCQSKRYLTVHIDEKWCFHREYSGRVSKFEHRKIMPVLILSTGCFLLYFQSNNLKQIIYFAFKCSIKIALLYLL